MAVLAVGIGVGCGARTATLDFDDGLNSTGGVSGSLSRGGTSSGATAGRSFAGTGSFAGTSFGGTSFGGAVSFGGTSVGGATSFGGTSVGGTSVGGAIGFAGFGAVGAVGGTGFAGSTNHQECAALSGSVCGQCQCNACYTPFVGCITDGGCAILFACVVQKGCAGLDCYKPSKCAAVIDALGGLGSPSVRAAIALVSCATASACAGCGG